MTRPLKDRETGEPAQNISLTLTRPRLDWLRELAARRNTSVSSAVEHLIDRARGGGRNEVMTVVEDVRVPEPGPSFTVTPGGQGDPLLKAAVESLKRGDEAKRNVAQFPEPADEPSTRKYVEPRLKKGGAK